MKKSCLFSVVLSFCSASYVQAQNPGTPEASTIPDISAETKVYFINLKDGDKVRSPFVIRFGLKGMGIAPAGHNVPGTGHHHLLVDMPLPADPRDGIPFSDKHRHFGKGVTETVLELSPGSHTLRLLFADSDHRPYYVFSKEIRITVVQ